MPDSIAQKVRDRIVLGTLLAKKWLAQHLRPSKQPCIPIFLIGCQRSGSNMFNDVLDLSNEIWIYNEADGGPAFDNFRIRSDASIDALLKQTRAKYAMFKPLADSQWADRLLKLRPNSKAIWIYRSYFAVAGSAVNKWGDHQREVIRCIVEGDLISVGWRAERITPETVEILKRVYTPDLTEFEGACLKWYVRNQIFFDLKLEERDDVTMIKYEDLVLRPKETWPRVFQYLGMEFREAFIRNVFSSSVGRDKDHPLRPEVKALCDEMMARLDEAYKKRGILALSK